jgi:hypothetical protein
LADTSDDDFSLGLNAIEWVEIADTAGEGI